MNTKELNLVKNELTALEALMMKRKICWEAEYENGEYALGEFKVKDFCESLIGKLETERMSLNLLRTDLYNTQKKLSSRDELIKAADEVIDEVRLAQMPPAQAVAVVKLLYKYDSKKETATTLKQQMK